MAEGKDRTGKQDGKGHRGKFKGTIFERWFGDRKRYVGEVNLGYDAQGKRKRKTVYGDTLEEVQDEMIRLQGDALEGSLTEPSGAKLEAYLADWLENTVRPNRRATTYVSYEGVIRNHVNTHMGGVRLDRLTSAHMDNLFSSMVRAGASPRTRQLAYRVLKRALKKAIRRRWVSRSVWDEVECPAVPKKSMRYYDPEQVGRLLKAAEGLRLETLFYVAVFGGLRQGELFGLTWREVDFERGLVNVRHTLQEVKGRLALKEPKSKAGERTVVLPPFVVAKLNDHRQRMLAEGRDVKEGPVFCDSHGGWLRKSNFTRQVFKPLLAKAGLPDVRFHDLRHTSATLLLGLDVNPKLVQERLGHGQVKLTLDTYTHVLPSLQKDVADKLERAFGKTPGEARQSG
jgi:integrase